MKITTENQDIKRKEIEAATITMMSIHGMDWSLADLCIKLGNRKSLIHYYYNSKHELIKCALDRYQNSDTFVAQVGLPVSQLASFTTAKDYFNTFLNC